MTLTEWLVFVLMMAVVAAASFFVLWRTEFLKFSEMREDRDFWRQCCLNERQYWVNYLKLREEELDDAGHGQ